MNATQRIVPLLWLSVALATGCATQRSPLTFYAGLEPGLETVWPLPPEAPRVRYQGELTSQESIGFSHSFGQRLRHAVLGTDLGDDILVHRPFDVHVAVDGRIFVSNGMQGSVMRFDPLRKQAEEITPTGAGVLAKPMGLSGDENGLLYVADPVQRRVVALTADGDFVRAFGGRGVLLNPVDVAVSDAGDRIYVADSYLHQVVVFRDDGTLLRRIGKDAGDLDEKIERRAALLASAVPGHPVSEPSDLTENRSNAPGEFRYPAFIDVGPDGTVYVSDGMNFRVQAFDRDGDYLFAFGRQGDSPGSFARPKGLAVNSEGHVYVADAAFNNVQIFDATGRLLLSFGAIGGGPGQLWLPLGIAIDGQDRVYVADRYNSRIQIYQYHPSPDAPATDPLIPASQGNH
ncbi:MAG: hypothetical protein R2834_24270 [Rhodothermales bacterium]